MKPAKDEQRQSDATEAMPRYGDIFGLFLESDFLLWGADSLWRRC